MGMSLIFCSSYSVQKGTRYNTFNNVLCRDFPVQGSVQGVVGISQGRHEERLSL